MKSKTGSPEDWRGSIRRETGECVDAWRYRVARSRPMIQWSRSCFGKLNGEDYVFAVTHGRGRSYAYFKWNGELLYFSTGAHALVDNEVIEYEPSAARSNPGERAELLGVSDPAETLPGRAAKEDRTAGSDLERRLWGLAVSAHAQ